MNLVKVLAAAVVGAALAIGLMVGLEAYARMEFAWTIVALGFLIGLAMRWIAGTGRESYARGALAALLTLMAFIAGKYVVASVITTDRQLDLPPPSADAPADDGSEDESTEAVEPAAVAPLDLPEREPGAILQTNPSNMKISTLDALWLVVGALVAYQLGKGGNTAAGKTISTTGSDSEEKPQRQMGDDPSN